MGWVIQGRPYDVKGERRVARRMNWKILPILLGVRGPMLPHLSLDAHCDVLYLAASPPPLPSLVPRRGTP